jgi:hypothetical protein
MSLPGSALKYAQVRFSDRKKERTDDTLTQHLYVHLWPILSATSIPPPDTRLAEAEGNEADDLALDCYTKLAHGEELDPFDILVEHGFGVCDGVVLAL